MEPLSNKTLIIVRHAHRDKNLGRSSDNGLSEKGKAQAKRVLAHYQETFGKRKALVQSSPKKRCVETVQPIAELLKVELEIEELMDEQHGDESHKDFDERYEGYYKWWRKKGPELTVICSHGDWIPYFIEEATGAAVDLAKGGWAELVENKKDDKVELKWLFQSFEHENP